MTTLFLPGEVRSLYSGVSRSHVLKQDVRVAWSPAALRLALFSGSLVTFVNAGSANVRFRLVPCVLSTLLQKHDASTLLQKHDDAVRLCDADVQCVSISEKVVKSAL
jgi:hypothetical protein